MNVRHAVLCERIKARPRIFGFGPPDPPTSEEKLQETEQSLGFTLPAVLSKLYLEYGNGGEDYFDQSCPVSAARHALLWNPEKYSMVAIDAPSELEQSVARCDWRLPAEVVSELRQHPGS